LEDIASTSSMKRMQGASCLDSSNSRRNLSSDSPDKPPIICSTVI